MEPITVPYAGGPLVVAATGHRPGKLGLSQRIGADFHIAAIARAFLMQLRPDTVVTGMARGWDMIVAEQCLRLRIPYVAAIPASRLEQTGGWTYTEVSKYHHLVNQAAEHIIPGTIFNAAVAHERNRWMVDRAHLVVAMWNGSNSGTSNAINYAETRGVPVVNLWPLKP